MAAKFFVVPYQCVVVSGLAVPGATLTFYQTGTTNKLPVYTTDALTTERTNPVVANGSGHIPDTYLDNTYTYRVVFKDRFGAVLEDVDPYIPGTTQLGITITTATGSTVSTVAALEGIVAPVNDQLAFFDDSMWIVEAYDSALVTADPRKAAYVRSTTDNTKMWVRRRDSNYLHIDWFGAVGDGTTDDTSAFTAARTLSEALAVSGDSGSKAGPKLVFGPKAYKLASSLSWKGCSQIWDGQDAGVEQYAHSTTILMASGATLTFERGNTENGGVGSAISAAGADGTILRNITFSGPGNGVGAAPVVKWRCKVTAENCRFINGGSHGLSIQATSTGGGALEGNANVWSVRGGACSNNGGSGLAVGTVANGDVNGGSVRGGSFMGNARYGIEDLSFLSNVYDYDHIAGNTLGPILQTNANAPCSFKGYIEDDYTNLTIGPKSTITGFVRADKVLGGAWFGGDVSGYFSVNSFHAFGAVLVEGSSSFLQGVGAWNGQSIAAFENTGSGNFLSMRAAAAGGFLTSFNAGSGLYKPLTIAASVVSFDIAGGALVNAVDDAAAAAASVPVRGLYRNGSVVMVRVA